MIMALHAHTQRYFSSDVIQNICQKDTNTHTHTHSGVPRNFVRGGWGGQQIQLRTEDRENGDLGAVAPWSGVQQAAVIWYKKFHFI